MMRKGLAVFLAFFTLGNGWIFAQSLGAGGELISAINPGNLSSSINLLLSLSLITLVPFFLMSTTSF